jgi:ABC-type lipoprotein export system ATPase subunit
VSAVDVRDAYRIFGSGAGASVALQGLTLAVRPEEIVVVLGPSGSGKTTLLRVVAGLESLSAGTVQVLGADVSRLGRGQLARFRAESIGFLDQHYTRALSPDLSIRETVALPLELRGSDPREARRVADALLDRVGLLSRGGDRPRSLSGGEQQRVAVCATVAQRPRLILADEPAGELDAANAALVYELIAELAHEVRAAALIVSHDPAAAAIADRRVHVRDGRVVAHAKPGEEPVLTVGKGGWLRLPPEAFDRMPELVSLEHRQHAVVVRPLRADPTPGHLEAGARVRNRRSDAPRVAAELRGVRKVFRTNGAERVVLDGIDLRVERGRLLGIVGRSGVGKTTLLHLLAGLERPTAGEVDVGGEPLTGRRRSELAGLRRAGICLVTQEPGLVPHLSARENVLLGLDLRGTSSPGPRADAALVEVGLLEKTGQRAASLSAGERQRLAIARALAAAGMLLLADEPTARLDQENAADIGRLLARAAHEHGLAVVCATHDPAVIELADEVVHLEHAIPRSSAG